MGYDIHITRKADWFDEGGDDISLEEWNRYVATYEKDGNMALFHHFEGNVTVKNPDKEILRMMFSIAQSLNAKVQGDDCEVYDAAGQSDEQRPKQQPDALASEKKWWQFWK